MWLIGVSLPTCKSEVKQFSYILNIYSMSTSTCLWSDAFWIITSPYTIISIKILSVQFFLKMTLAVLICIFSMQRLQINRKYPDTFCYVSYFYLLEIYFPFYSLIPCRRLELLLCNIGRKITSRTPAWLKRDVIYKERFGCRLWNFLFHVFY